MDSLVELVRLADRVVAERARVSDRFARTTGGAEGLAIPAAMLDQVVRAGMLPGGFPAAEDHYAELMPVQLLDQQRHPLFSAPLDPRHMPRLRAAFAGLARVLDTARLPPPPPLRRGVTLGALYARTYFGRSMPMLYAYPADLARIGRGRGGWSARIDRHLVGPLVHEMAHLVPADPDAAPLPTNLHEALAAYIGFQAFPAQVFPGPGDADALAGAPWFMLLGQAIARRAGGREAAARVQAGTLPLREALGEPLHESVQRAAWAEIERERRPHLLPGAFRLEGWLKLLDAARDPATLSGVERAADPVAAATGIAWRDLPAWRDAPDPLDLEWAAAAERACRQRVLREDGTFRVAPVAAARVVVDTAACAVRRVWPDPEDPDTIGAPGAIPFPPSVARRLSGARPG